MMVGSSETFAFYYAVKRDVTETQLALLTTAPVLLGALCNWLIPYWTKHRHLKGGVLSSVFIQILGLLGLLVSIHLSQPFWTIFISLSLYWMGGLTASPLWIDWISGWLPHGRFGRFYSRRNGFVAMMTVVTYLLASFLLSGENNISIFKIVFSAAIIFRSISLLMLCLQKTAVTRRPIKDSTEPLSAIFRSRLIFGMILFTVLFRYVSNFATPFLTPYMMNELHFDLRAFAWITAVPFLGRMISQSHWGELSRKNLSLPALQVSMIMIAGVCLVWSMAKSIEVLTIAEISSGIFWGAFELFTIVMIQEFLPGDARGIIGFHICLTNLAATLGAMSGAFLLNSHFSFTEVFQISAGLRFCVALGFIAFLAPWRRMKKFAKVHLNA
ncbi:MAG: MFS transporter [Deltaproteobacteria bacterium]|nr:MFS transporter [Deltaproteobacteria bacterium]